MEGEACASHTEMDGGVPGVHVHSQPTDEWTDVKGQKSKVYDSNYWLCTITIDDDVRYIVDTIKANIL